MESMLAGATAAICMLLGSRLRYAPFKEVLTSKQHKLITTFHGILAVLQMTIMAVLILVFGSDIILPLTRVSAIVFAVISFAFNMFTIKKWRLEQFFVGGVVFTCNYALMSIPNLIGSLLPDIGDMVHFFVIEDLYLLVLIITHIPLYRLLTGTVSPFLKMDIGNYWNTIWFIPLALFGTRLVALGQKDFQGSISRFICDMLTAVIIILMCKSIAADHVRMRERQIVDEQLAAQKLHYAKLKFRVEDARRTKHDFKHHITAIHHYMDIDDIEGLRSYCNELMEQHSEQNKIPYTGNAAADGVIYHYMSLAQEKKAELHYSGAIHSDGISDTDLCALLGNALDNALQGCMTVQEGRSINIICQSEEHLLSIAVRNTFDGRVDRSEKGVLSRKRENRTGVGLMSMGDICKKYGGSLETSWDDRTFTLMVLLPLTKTE